MYDCLLVSGGEFSISKVLLSLYKCVAQELSRFLLHPTQVGFELICANWHTHILIFGCH